MGNGNLNFCDILGPSWELGTWELTTRNDILVRRPSWETKTLNRTWVLQRLIDAFGACALPRRAAARVADGAGARWLGGMASLLLPIAMAALCGSATVAASTSNLNARLLRGEYVLRCLTWTGSLVVSFVYIAGPLIEVLPCWSEQVPRFCGASATGTTDIVL